MDSTGDVRKSLDHLAWVCGTLAAQQAELAKQIAGLTSVINIQAEQLAETRYAFNHATQSRPMQAEEDARADARLEQRARPQPDGAVRPR